MIAEQPLTGIGLGNYRYLSQQYREASLSQSLAIHSDNSWLLLAAEAGLPTALAAAALVVLAFLRLRGCRRHPSWSVRWASAAAVALFVGHCAVDVPAHRAATLLPALFLAGLAFRQLPATRPSRPTPSRKASYAFFAAAGAALLVAGAWMGGWLPSTQAKTLPTDEIEKAPEWIYTLHQHRHTEEAITLAQNILTRTPLSAGLYFQWGAMELTFEGTEKTVDNLFAIERALEPHFITTPLRQAVVWMNVDPERSLRLFADAMERAHQQDRCGGGHYASNTFDAILQNTAKTPELSDKLYPLTDNRPDLLLLWGNAASPSAFRLVLHKILARDPSLAQWEPGGQLKLLRLWSSKGDRTELQNLLHVRPSLQNAAWPILAGELARSQQYEQAWRIADAQLHLNTFDFYREEAPSGRLRAAYEENKTAIAAERLAKALFKEGDFEGVLQFTAKARTANALSPNLSRVASVAATRLARWPDAWAHLVDLVRAKNPELLPE